MNRPKTRIGVIHALLKKHGVTQNELAGFAGCGLPQIKKLMKVPKVGGRKLDESYAVGIAVETGLSLEWLMNRLGHWRKPLARFMEPWTPEVYLRIRKTKDTKGSLPAEATMCMKYFLVNTDRLATLILAGFKQNKANRALSRIHLALTRLAKDFQVREPDRVVSILRRTIIRRRAVHKTSSAIARRFCRELWAHVRHTATKQSVDAYRARRAAEKYSHASGQ